MITSVRNRGFSRVDLAVTLAVSLGIAGALLVSCSLHPASHVQCGMNLKELGIAMAIYEKDNDDRLPYAYIKPEPDSDRKSKVWDALIFPLIPLNSQGLAQKHLFRCPADTIPRNGARPQRTYAMPVHNMRKEDWPPGPKNDTGVGLYWEAGHGGIADTTNLVLETKGAASRADAESKKSPLPAIRLSMIPAPTRTLLLTENAHPLNILFSPSGATIRNPSQHVQTSLIKMEDYHRGRINYLMVDGHVEFMNPWESVGQNDPTSSVSAKDYPNIWTIRPDD